MQHGDGLICIFPECRNRGIKFLYCAFCKDPVAKRNFRNRHTHEDNVDSSDRPFKMQKMTKSVPSSRPNTNAPNASKAPHEVSEGAGSSNNGSGEGWPSNSNLVSRQTAMLPRKRPHYLKESQKRSTTAAAMSSETDTTSQEKSARVDTKRVDAWTMLLAERPSTDQSDAMSKWLMKVMAISDLKKSTAQAIAVAKASNSDMGSSNEGSNDGASPGDESSPTDDSSPTESSSDDTGQNVKKMPSSKPTSSNDASNEDSSPTNSNDSSNDSSSDNQDEDMDIKEIWIRD